MNEKLTQTLSVLPPYSPAPDTSLFHTLPSGLLYSGPFDSFHRKCGLGVLVFPDFSKYEGEFRED